MRDGATMRPALLTSEQYLALPEEFDQNGNRIKDELIGGEIVKMPPPSRWHDLIKNRINRLFGRYLDANPQIALETLVEIGAEVSKHDTFVPDVSVVRRERLGGEDRIFRGAPDLAIEVLSPSDRAASMRRKVKQYFAVGSKAVWLVYPQTREVEVWESETGPARVLGDQGVLEAPGLFPGFSLKVSGLF